MIGKCTELPPMSDRYGDIGIAVDFEAGAIVCGQQWFREQCEQRAGGNLSVGVRFYVPCGYCLRQLQVHQTMPISVPCYAHWVETQRREARTSRLLH